MSEVLDKVNEIIREELGEIDGEVITDIIIGYAEPSYGTIWTHDDEVIVLGNWNPKRFVREDDPPLTDDENIGPRLAEKLEEAGAECAWLDEWVQCDECYRAIRSVPDSYSWTMYGAFIEGGYVCAGCMKENVDSSLQEYINDHQRAVTWANGADLADAGWTQWEELDPHQYETGWHDGQTDDPAKVLESILEWKSTAEVVFLVNSVGQFDIRWSAWVKDDEGNK